MTWKYEGMDVHEGILTSGRQKPIGNSSSFGLLCGWFLNHLLREDFLKVPQKVQVRVSTSALWQWSANAVTRSWLAFPPSDLLPLYSPCPVAWYHIMKLPAQENSKSLFLGDPRVRQTASKVVKCSSTLNAMYRFSITWALINSRNCYIKW